MNDSNRTADDYLAAGWTISIEPGFVTDGNGGRICDYRPWAHAADSADDHGQLLAAAPRILTALRMLLADAEREREDNNRMRTADGWDAEREPDSFAAARDAIAAATRANQQIE